MKVSIQVANREEGNMIVAGLADPDTMALVRIVGLLSALAPEQQRRVLGYVLGRLNAHTREQLAQLAASLREGNGPLVRAEPDGEPALPGLE